ncbi:hypothetical protein GMES_2669 [Paraglaciecola mesophila KMM 241]|uniref:Uncharacterized protein n=1 Tax=Paraglaciecola mesophila KMM 241 TaxID=1128912 RepID=K6Z7K8_9ALTE|nr:hypothetical protein GMES_2669 [Paraglaciecola mesophila KMM 241]
MLRLLFLLPLILCLLWFAYLRLRGFSLRQGKQGFIYILVFSAIIAAFYTLMLWLTAT